MKVLMCETNILVLKNVSKSFTIKSQKLQKSTFCNPSTIPAPLFPPPNQLIRLNDVFQGEWRRDDEVGVVEITEEFEGSFSHGDSELEVIVHVAVKCGFVVVWWVGRCVCGWVRMWVGAHVGGWMWIREAYMRMWVNG